MLGGLLLHRDRVSSLGTPIQALTPGNIFYADTALSVCYLLFHIPTWVFLARPSEEEMIILGTYGSVFLMINFGIHFYFAAAEALHIVTTRQTPFQSLAAEYTPLNEGHRDDVEAMEEGTARPT